MTFDTMLAETALAALSNSTNARFHSHFWTELQIGDKRVPIIGLLHYGKAHDLQSQSYTHC